MRAVQHLRWSGGVLPLSLLYIALVLWMSAHVPPFEAPDATYHFAVIDYLAEAGGLPPGAHPQAHAWRQMAYHAPLYYMIAAALIAPLDRPDFSTAYPLNPHAQVGEPHAADNQNIVAHIPQDDLAVWIVRGFSMALGLLTVLGVWRLTRLLWPSAPMIATLAALILVLNPQFLFSHAQITNDALVIALSTGTLVMLAWIIRHGLTLQGLSIVAVIVAAASLAKASGLALYPAVMLGVSYVCWRDKTPLPRVALYAVIGLSAWALIAGWWYAHNWMQYGDFAATSQIAAATGARNGPILDLAGEMRGLYYSFWGLFGWFNVSPPEAYYLIPSALILVGFIGVMRGLFRRAPFTRDDGVLMALGLLYTLTLLLSWWGFHQQVNAAQGRLWFPLLGVFAPILAFGLWNIPRWVGGVLLAGMLGAALIFPVAVIKPAYTPIDAIPAQTWHAPEDAALFHVREPWNEQACLSVWTTPPTRSADGRTVTVDLWFRVDCAFTGFWSAFIHRIDLARETCQAGDTGHILAQYDTMPSGGDRPFPAMRPGWIYPDTLTVTLPPGVSLDNATHLHVGLYDAGGTFMRAFITADSASAPAWVRVGDCAPETMLYTLAD